MEAKHAFMKGLSGYGIFYRTEDFLVFITIVSVLVRKMNLTILSFCPMFNHIHFLIKDISKQRLRSFIQRVAITFVKQYNMYYSREGSLFKKAFGYSIKRSVKIIMGSCAYVFNNTVAGKLFKTAKEYKWNLLAYLESDHPFSKPLVKKTCRHKMRIFLEKVDYFNKNNMYLTYNVLESIFDKIKKEEHSQLVDYILSKYSFLSKEALLELYADYDHLIAAINSNAGSEYELEDEYGDHSCYRTMLGIVRKLGYKGNKLNFEALPSEEVDDLYNLILSNTAIPSYNINRFLHRAGGT